jgi:hypothetical protein
VTALRGPYPPDHVAKIAEAVMGEHDWRWALRDAKTDEGVRIACTAPDCEWFAEREAGGPDLWDLHRAHVGVVIAAELEEVSATVPPVTKPPMVMRSHRYPRKLYDAAMRKAVEREENLSDVLREALERYVNNNTPERRPLSIDHCPTCGSVVDTVEGSGMTPSTWRNFARPCGHRVEVTMWPDRVQLERR